MALPQPPAVPRVGAPRPMRSPLPAADDSSIAQTDVARPPRSLQHAPLSTDDSLTAAGRALTGNAEGVEDITLPRLASLQLESGNPRVFTAEGEDVMDTTLPRHFPLLHAQRKFEEIAEALYGSPFLTLSVVEGTSSGDAAIISLTTGDFTQDVKAIVLACMISCKVDVQRYLPELCKAQRPIIALCVDEGVSFHANQIQDAHDYFLRLGASDVVLQWASGNDLQLAINMRVRSALHNYSLRRDEVNYRLKEQLASMFWPFVGRIMEGFPALERGHSRVLAPGVRVGPRIIEECIRRDNARTIFRCYNESGEKRECLKAIRKTSMKYLAAVKQVWKEITLLQALQHPNIVRFEAAVHTPSHILIFMDFAGPNNLYVHIRRWNLQANTGEAMHIIGQVVAGIAHCHERGVAHRDIKPENIVVMDGDDGRANIRIVDFGSAVQRAETCRGFVGTFPFIAPEVSREQYDPASADMWSCGVVFLELLCGIGKICRLLGWQPPPSSRERYREQLEHFFSNHHNLTASVETHFGRVGSTSFPTHAHAALVGMLTPFPLRRWDATRVHDCFERRSLAAVSTVGA